MEDMARPKNQHARREQIVAAALRAIVSRGLTGLRIKDVAAEAKMSAGSISYYYAGLDDLLVDVHRHAVDRFYWQRLRAIEGSDDPREKLIIMARSGLPESREDLLCQVLYELHVHASRSTTHAALMTSLFDREVSLYLTILSVGQATGAFTLTSAVDTVARNLVALEDAYGLHIVAGNTAVSPQQATVLILAYASTATGCELAA